MCKCAKSFSLWDIVPQIYQSYAAGPHWGLLITQLP